MSVAQVSGEWMAVIIPFPVDRVRKAPDVVEEKESTVVCLPTSGNEESPRDQKRAHNISIYALAKRGMSRKEMEHRLLSRDLDEATVRVELERLTAAGLLDDRALAHELVDKYSRRASWGSRAVMLKLRERGIPDSIIEEALSLVSDGVEEEAMRELARKKLSTLGHEPKDAQTRKLGGFLLRKGFAPDRVYELVRELVV